MTVGDPESVPAAVKTQFEAFNKEFDAVRVKFGVPQTAPGGGRGGQGGGGAATAAAAGGRGGAAPAGAAQAAPAAATPVPATENVVQPPATRAFTAMPVPTLAAENIQEAPHMNEVPLPIPLDPAMQKVVDQARDDLAAKLAVDAASIELVGVSTVTWPDGSLGCPQPGMMYTQVLVDGLLIRFKAGGQVYEYHGGGSRTPFLCKNPLGK